MKILAALLLATLATFASAEERMITKQVVVKAPLPQVWDAWTTTEGIKTFFAPDGHVEARPDGPFEIYINPYAEPGKKGADDMRVLSVQPLRMLSFTWNAPPSLPEARKERTVVILRFASVSENETRVTLTHVGWGDGGEWDKAYAYFDKIWDKVLGNLQTRFATGPIDWTEWLARLKPPEK
ncbi:MAG: SRPBCC domain-containing protein [Usitatibacter sp.]